MARMAVFVLLAAGSSARMGRPKALLPHPAGAPMARVWLDRARAAGLHKRVVVGGADPQALRALLEEEELWVHNPQWSTTKMRESLMLAAELCPGEDMLFTPVDVPPCSVQALGDLAGTQGAAVLGHHGAPGHPARIPGGRDLASFPTLRPHLKGAHVVEGGPDCLLNLNHPADYAAWFTRAARG